MAQTAPYPTVAAPYGLKPINLIGGQVFAGSTRLLKVTNSYATAIFYGDVVKVVAGGTVEKDIGEATATPVGIFLGCVYTNPTNGQKTYAQYWPGGLTATDIYAYVAVNDSVEQADRLFAALRQACLKLRRLPLRGNIPTELFEIGVMEFRELHHKPYRIIYSLESNTVYVHCVLDGRRDIQDLLQGRLLR